MRSYHGELFTPRQHALLRLATKIFDAIPQARPVEQFRCHEVARIVGNLLELPVEDGKYGPIDHSWCWVKTEAGQGAPALLDPYAIGCMPPVRLVSLDALITPHCGSYVVGEARTDIDGRLVEAVVNRLEPEVAKWKRFEPNL